MYCNRDLKLMFVAVPKNASRSTARVLLRKGFVRRGKHHSFEVDLAKRRIEMGWRLFICCRNPFSRAVSEWDDIRQRDWNSPDLIPHHAYFRDKPFIEFVRFLATGDLPVKFVSQCKFIEDLPVTDVIRFESLKPDLERLVGPVRLPHLTAGQYGGDWKKYYDAEAIECVRKWAADDFERFGYSQDLT